jgi:hypothetical protein
MWVCIWVCGPQAGSTILALPQLIAIAIVLPKNWHWQACDGQLDVWLIMLGVQLIGRLALVYSVYFKPQLSAYCKGLDTALSVLQFILLILGVVWILQSRTCRTADPIAWKLSFCLLICLSIIICLPMIMLCLCLPVAYFCTPCLHRILGVWVRTDHTERTDHMM